jgi:dTDP-4-dehydrorhamnose 3,5-epimerase
MSIETTSLPGVLIFTPRVFKDTRGFFCESYNYDVWRAAGIETIFVQDNHSRSVRHTIRGLHFQLPPAAQVKLLRVVRGAVWDVAVDIRKGSPTLGRWVGVELTEDNFRQLYIPEGFAHGFCVLSESADVLYKTSCVYSPGHEQGIRWNDPAVSIPWPAGEPLLSDRDRQSQSLAEYLEKTPFVYGNET